MGEFQIEDVCADCIRAPLALLETALRDGHPVSESFVGQLARAVKRGDLDVLAAWKGSEMVGVAVVSYRLNASAGSLFASIEDLYVRPTIAARERPAPCWMQPRKGAPCAVHLTLKFR